MIILKGSTRSTAISSESSDTTIQPWKEQPAPKLFSSSKEKIIVVKKKKKAFQLSKFPSVMLNAQDKPAWVRTVEQPIKQRKILTSSSKHRELSSVSLLSSASSPSLLISTGALNPDIIYVDGTPYMKLNSSNSKKGSVQSSATNIIFEPEILSIPKLEAVLPELPVCITIENKGSSK